MANEKYIADKETLDLVKADTTEIKNKATNIIDKSQTLINKVTDVQTKTNDIQNKVSKLSNTASFVYPFVNASNVYASRTKSGFLEGETLISLTGPGLVVSNIHLKLEDGVHVKIICDDRTLTVENDDVNFHNFYFNITQDANYNYYDIFSMNKTSIPYSETTLKMPNGLFFKNKLEFKISKMTVNRSATLYPFNYGLF